MFMPLQMRFSKGRRAVLRSLPAVLLSDLKEHFDKL